MAKSKSPAADRRATAGEIRHQIEKCDRELLHALAERTRLGQRLMRALEAEGRPAIDFAEEHDVLARVAAANKGPLPERTVRAIYRELLGGVRSLHKVVKVAYLGPAYSYSHVAAIEKFGQSAELVPVGTIAAVFEEVNRKQAEYGIVPIENSTDGRIVDTLDMFARLPVRICGEVQLRIHHYLLGKCPRAQVQEVYSKPQALSQCRDWLARHLPAARLVEMTSTASAAQLAAERENAAAIAGLQAAVNYGLEVLAGNIEDNKHNVTRFAVIGSEPAPRSGRDKSALMFQIPHKPGALADAMLVFKRARLNLTWIESFPLAGSQNEYLFFAELEGHPTDARVKSAIEKLGKKTVRLEVLGAYARTEPRE